jgi:hypothetical protein
MPMQVFSELVFELINYLIGRKEQKERKILLGQRLIFLGAFLTLFALLLFIISITHGGIVGVMWFAIGPFLIVGIPSLVIGIIRLNNP